MLARSGRTPAYSSAISIGCQIVLVPQAADMEDSGDTTARQRTTILVDSGMTHS